MFSRFDPRRFSAILSVICVGLFIFQNKIANIETRINDSLFWFALGPWVLGWPPGLGGWGSLVLVCPWALAPWAGRLGFSDIGGNLVRLVYFGLYLIALTIPSPILISILSQSPPRPSPFQPFRAIWVCFPN